MTDAAFCVLSDPVLFRDIVSWGSGWPALVAHRWLEIKAARQATHQPVLHVRRALRPGESPVPPPLMPLYRPSAYRLQPHEFVLDLILKCDVRTLDVLKKANSWSTATRVKFSIRDAGPAIVKGDADAVRLAFEWVDGTSATQEHQYWHDAIDHYPGHCRVVELLDTYVPLTWSAAKQIAAQRLREREDVPLFTWFLEKFGPTILPKTMMHIAAVNANVNLVRFFHSVPGQELEPSTFIQVYRQLRLWGSRDHNIEATGAENDCAEIFEFLLQNRSEDIPPQLDAEALEAGDADTLELIAAHRGGLRASGGSADLAAARGFLKAIQVVARHGSLACSSAALDKAAANGHLDVVQFLHEWGFSECTSAAMDDAAGNGHLNIVVFLHKNRWEGCTTAAMDRAATENHYDVVKYLHDNRTEGCTGAAFKYAPLSTPLSEARKILLFLLANRTEIHPESLETEVLKHRDIEVLLLIKQTRGIRFILDVMLDDFAATGDLDFMKFLTEHLSAICSPHAMDAAAANGHLHVVKYLHEHHEGGCTTAAMDMAATFGHWDVVEFLDENRSEGCTSVVLNAAVRLGRMDLVQRYSKNAALMTISAAVFVAGAYSQSEVKAYLELWKQEMLVDLRR